MNGIIPQTTLSVALNLPSASSSLPSSVQNTVAEIFNQVATRPLQQKMPPDIAPPLTPTEWMCEALAGKQHPYRVRHGELRIEVYRETVVQFAKEHLTLLTEALKKQWNTLPQSSCVSYLWGSKREEGVDQGALSRQFWHYLLPNIAEQTQDRPLLKPDDSGFYKLESTDSTLAAEESALCEQIGNLLCLFASGLGNEVKLGPVFPTHFYAALLHLYIKFTQTDCSLSFQQLSLLDQQQLCYIFARENQDGPKSNDGQLLFSLPPTKETHTGEIGCITHYTPEDLHKVWCLLHYQLGAEEGSEILLKKFPEMREFINCSEGTFVAPQDLMRFAEIFKKSLSSSEELKAFIQETLLQCAFDLYHRECQPLFTVMHGFKEISPQKISPFLTLCFTQSITAASQALSALVQSPPFTREAFLNLLMKSSGSIAVREKMRWVQEWYNSLPANCAKSEKKMKKLLRCMNGAEGFTADIRFRFDKPAGDYSIFHSCTRSVNMGQELLNETDKELFIKKWRKHVNFGLLSGFSRR